MVLVIVSLVLFAGSAYLGISTLVRRAQGEVPSSAADYAHGAISIAALVLVIVYSVSHSDSLSDWAFRIFVVSALAGFVLFGIDFATKKMPAWLALLHGVLGLAGFVFLLVFAISTAMR